MGDKVAKSDWKAHPYQFYTLFFPYLLLLDLTSSKKIMKEFTREIRKFMWQGGKSNILKKFHLVNWENLCKPKIYGGDGIRDPSKMNLSLRDKILWRIVTGE